MTDIHNRHSHPIELRDATVTDPFWAAEQELVRTAVIPYQWNALNDNVPGAAPSYCMHNFKAAAAQNAERHEQGKAFVPPKYTFRGFEALPEDPANPDPDKFYGFVFQDTDFSKWIEAVGYSLTHHPDAELEATADAAIDIVCAAQLDNGYLDTYYILNGMDRHFTNLKDHHELYCFGHLVEGAVAYYEATGKRKLLDAACRFADYIDSRFGTEEGRLHGYPGHEIAEMALVKLAAVTGETRYADLAEYFVWQRGQQPLYFALEDRRRAEEDGRNYESREQNYTYYQAGHGTNGGARSCRARRLLLLRRGRRGENHRGSSTAGILRDALAQHRRQETVYHRRHRCHAYGRGVLLRLRSAERHRLLGKLRGHRTRVLCAPYA